MGSEHRGRVKLVGASHWVPWGQLDVTPYDPGTGNYTQVKRLLERERNLHL